jgi:integrase
MALAARRSELVALDVSDLEWGEQGARVTIRDSKTDQTAEAPWSPCRRGATSAPSPICAPGCRPLRSSRVRSSGRYGRWQRVRDTRLSDHAVARILQARAEAAGLDSQRYGGHSLRAGFLTAAARAGADVWKIQRQVSRHRSMQVLSGYVRDARLFDDHAGEPFL